jgi:hypothetical protein
MAKTPRAIATLKVDSTANAGYFWRVRLFKDLDVLSRVMEAPKVLAGFITDLPEGHGRCLGTFCFALGYTASNIVAHEIFHSLVCDISAIIHAGVRMSTQAEELIVLDYENLFKVITAWLVDPMKKGI